MTTGDVSPSTPRATASTRTFSPLGSAPHKDRRGNRRKRGLVFHSLRHRFATALADRIDQRQAMKATGHRTSVVFESYADHEREDHLATIGRASEDAFGKVLEFAAKKGA